MFARFDENPAMTLQNIKETKRYGRTDGRTHGRTHTRTDNVKTVYPPQTKFAGGIMKSYQAQNFYISENIYHRSLAIVMIMFLVNDKLVWRDKTVTQDLELCCT